VSDPQANELLDQADQTFRSRKYAESVPGYEAALTRAREAGDRSVEAEALAQIARAYSLTERLEEGRGWLQQAAAAADPALPLGWTRFLGVRGIYEREGGDKQSALATFVEMYDYSLAHDVPKRGIDAAHHAAIVAPPTEQLSWAEKGIAAAEAAQDEGWLAVLWNNLGASHEDAGRWEEAAEAYAKAKHYHYKTGSERAKLAADWALGRASLRAGQVEVARELLPGVLTRAQAWREREPEEKEAAEWVGFGATALGELRVHEGQRAAGLELLREGRALLVAGGIQKWWPGFLKDLDARIAQAEGE